MQNLDNQIFYVEKNRIGGVEKIKIQQNFVIDREYIGQSFDTSLSLTQGQQTSIYLTTPFISPTVGNYVYAIDNNNNYVCIGKITSFSKNEIKFTSLVSGTFNPTIYESSVDNPDDFVKVKYTIID